MLVIIFFNSRISPSSFIIPVFLSKFCIYISINVLTMTIWKYMFSKSIIWILWLLFSIVSLQFGLYLGSDGNKSACNARDLGSIPRSGRSPGDGNGNPLQYSWLGNPMDRGTWQAIVRAVAKSQTQLSN